MSVRHNDIVAYKVKHENGEERLIPLEMARIEQEGRITPVYFSEELGKKIFYEWVCKALEIAMKKISPSYLLGGCSHFSNEIRLDIYTFNERISESFIKNLIDKTEQLLKKGLKVEEVNVEEALKLLRDRHEIFYYELLNESKKDRVVIVRDDGNITLCLNECLPQTYIEPVLEYVNESTIHWKGEEKSFLLRRIHLKAFPSTHAKKAFAELEREYALRDHVTLGKELDLFISDKVIGAGLILWTPKGATIRKLMEDFEYKLHISHGYQPVVTPHIAGGELFERSGHLSYYRENMYVFDHEGKTLVVKPMNCPFHILLFKRRKWSYKELPVRYFEFGTVYRYERAGTLHGLARVRGLTQDDSHIFLTPEQIYDEIGRILDLLKKMYSAYGIRDYSFKLSLRDYQDKSKFIGPEELWAEAEQALESALLRHGISFEKAIGEAAFYGPKIDIFLKDSLGREWQCGTIQLDFNLPERFDLTYIDHDNKEKRIVIIHRALIGSIERFFAILLEYYAGRLPLWLSPIQVALLPVDENDRGQIEFVSRFRDELASIGIRAEVYAEGRLQARIRETRLHRIPLTVVIGEREIKDGSFEVSWIIYDIDQNGRYRPREEKIRFSNVGEFISWIKDEIRRETHGVFY